MELVSQLLERNAPIFENQKVIACGFFADEYIIDLAEKTSHMTIWLTDYNQFCSLARKLSIDFDPKVINLGSLLSSQDQKITLLFSEVLEKVSSDYTMGLLVISKNKNENKWYLRQLIKHTNTDALIYTAGPNDGGIRGMETVLKTLGHVSREDNARKCLLLQLRNTQKDQLANVEEPKTFTHYDFSINGISVKIAAMPGVFSAEELDDGTKLLLEQFANSKPQSLRNSNKYSFLDVGCGTGVIGIFLKLMYPNIQANCCDISAFALASAKESAKLNNVDIEIFASDMLNNSSVYDYIVTNPPFHSGIKQILGPTLELFENTPKHLRKNGEFFVIANAFLPYNDYLLHEFHNVNILSSNNKFKVYHILNNI